MNRVQKETFRAVVFDMDGVVIDTRTPIEAFWHRHAEAHGITISREVMEGRIHGCPAQQTVEGIFSHISKREQEHLLEACEVFENGLEYVAMRGGQSLLRQLKEASIPVALVTSSLPPKVRKVQGALGLEEAFTTIVTADLVERGKPDPACYRLAAEKLGLNPAQCIAFEDAYSGVKAAAGAGMYTAGVGPEVRETLLREAGAHLLVPDFGDVALRVEKQGGLVLQLTPSVLLPLSRADV
jgi:beta-phosphoglucomutase-like phosphatase (HAD superfamily)